MPKINFDRNAVEMVETALDEAKQIRQVVRSAHLKEENCYVIQSGIGLGMTYYFAVKCPILCVVREYTPQEANTLFDEFVADYGFEETLGRDMVL